MADQHEAAPANPRTGTGSSRALTIVGEARKPRSEERSSACFLAQLIACDRRIPTYRVARNAEPVRVLSAYAGQPGSLAARLDCLI